MRVEGSFVMRSANSLHPVMLAAADLGIGGVLYRELSAVLGGLLIAAGLLVFVTVAITALYHGGVNLRQHVSRWGNTSQ